ncbi:MAG: hypothetical protein HC902_11315, partial [Calothrix sp. SM1_5_4]|nr:hypothetical protein [Calothrix sp. SM1_5_4]
MLFWIQLAAVTEADVQSGIDDAFAAILNTQLGKAICTQILGADAGEIEMHLGVSRSAAKVLAAGCPFGATKHEWIYPTENGDIRKLKLRPGRPRHYRVVLTDRDYPIESWTEPFTNTTVILTKDPSITRARLIQVLAHEMAVYFDSKANPAHPDALRLPSLHELSLALQSRPGLDPLVALSNPLTAHTLTYARALQVEHAIVSELVGRGKIEEPADYGNPYVQHLLGPRCLEECLSRLIVNMRQSYL